MIEVLHNRRIEKFYIIFVEHSDGQKKTGTGVYFIFLDCIKSGSRVSDFEKAHKYRGKFTIIMIIANDVTKKCMHIFMHLFLKLKMYFFFHFD